MLTFASEVNSKFGLSLSLVINVVFKMFKQTKLKTISHAHNPFRWLTLFISEDNDLFNFPVLFEIRNKS